MVTNLVWFVSCLIFGLCVHQYKYRLSYLSHFNSKTAYRNSNLTEYWQSSDPLGQCKLIHTNVVFRHGTRFPSSKDISNMEDLFHKLNNSKKRSNLPKDLLSWKMPFVRNKDKQLTAVGIQEMMGLGRRFRELLFSTLSQHQLQGNIQVFSTSISRSRNSGNVFLRMFLNTSKSANDIDKMITIDDEHLRFFDGCPYYKIKVEKNKDMKREYNKFMKGREMRSLVKKVNRYIQLNDNPLTAEDLVVMYSLCGFEIATNSSSYMKPFQCPVNNGLVRCENDYHSIQTSPHCSLFDERDFPVLEYLFDLKHYWTKSYGHSITSMMSCKLMSRINQQIMEAVQAHKSSSTDIRFPKGIFWFSHAETILPLVALLGLFNQTIPMTSESFKNRLELVDKQKYRFALFRTANIVPFAANFGIHVFYCPHLSNGGLSGYQVRLKINEKTVPWPLTNHLSHISLEEFETRLLKCGPGSFNFTDQCKLVR